ncbi:hypothetical protein SPRG_11148 [Saprolegnia parasitica CBS 223.65]|uniref:Uncharacterized protein n=1 Tax=Saprolegnia parasitica (strain CBS 223.65) TaxID=695850 RepID=A0A067C9M1_SAPPC|nr:hypothetical protein SPRG_11148 [Saprolegnia parasitica CBS 223.65]KDO23216.1 hypothetical protein SPRG_11148 [Saprolegnia parasitica CBS 223.65]|eukprot:XP_012206015.1 hypothetical protein SPRG_11148 [Saprolegnia parasitica CBS 223.65]
MAGVQTLADAIQLTPASFGRDRHLVNVPAHMAALQQRYADPTSTLSTHALFVSPTKAYLALALHLSTVQATWRSSSDGFATRPGDISDARARGVSRPHCMPAVVTPTLMDLVAMAGDLPLLHWLHDAGAICTTDAMDGAAVNDVVAFLHVARTEGIAARSWRRWPC